MSTDQGHAAEPNSAALWGDLDSQDQKVARRAAGQLIAAYHQQQLLALLDHVRRGFAQLDAGEIDAFDLDDLIHRYTKCAAKLWSFCSTGGSGALAAARAVAYRRQHDDDVDWWEAWSPRPERITGVDEDRSEATVDNR
ncbi:MAG TPA: hypothetical protein VFP61_02635 [Acidimicrobiales bacterium]|nr:hypothetical protein [Acidimicrobiales bacterium]